MLKNNIMFIKDLPKDQQLIGLKIKLPDCSVVKLVSYWAKGIWVKKDNSNQVYPIQLNDIKDLLNMEVIN